MVRKPEIQYVGQFYIHGSEARELAPERKQPKTTLPPLPVEALKNIREISFDPVAITALVVAVVMLVTIAAGTIAVQNAWQEYEAMESYVYALRKENARLATEYRDSYDIEEIRTLAGTMGLIPRDEAEVRIIEVSVPENKTQPTAWEDFLWFLQGLFA